MPKALSQFNGSDDGSTSKVQRSNEAPLVTDEDAEQQHRSIILICLRLQYLASAAATCVHPQHP